MQVELMRYVNKVIGAVFFLVIAAVCVVVIRAAVHGHWSAFTACIGRVSPVAGVCFAVGILSLTALYLLTSAPPEKRQKLLSFDNDGGTVSITTVAICDYLGKLTPEFPSVIRLSPEVITARNNVDLIIGVRIKAGPQIHEVCEMLQQRVRESMTNGLGISQVRRIEVRVTDIVSEHRPA